MAKLHPNKSILFFTKFQEPTGFILIYEIFVGSERFSDFI